jgi:7-cyano-7-deazaguanine synthase
MAQDRPHAVVLLSGGLDSTTTLAIALAEGFVCHGITFDYGQRHRVELDAAARVAKAFDVASHRVCGIDLRAIGGSSLTDDIAVPKDRDSDEMARGVPITYVPARNTIFLSYALAVAEVSGSSDIFIGVNAVDYSGYPDCRPEYIEAFESMANLATRAGVEGHPVRIRTPLIRWPKTRIIEEGLRLGVDYGITFSCYDPVPDTSAVLGAHPCRRCDACRLRGRAFEELGLTDPG